MNEQHIAGYRVIRRLGGGGMGEVFLVEHPRLPRRDALKLLHSSVSSNPQYKGRFEREAYLLAQLNHRNIVHLYDRGEHNDRLWIAMEYVAGPDTAQLLAQNGPMPLPLAIEIAAGAGAALDYAYRHANITHRDVKPANILLAYDSDGTPQVKLADFGIAKAAGEAAGVTSTGITVGTMTYMSPEAFDNQILDNRADLYSLGCTAFELLTGTPPFPGDSPAAVISAHLHQPAPKITARAAHLPAHLDAVFRTALAKRPEDRYASCAEFVAGLRGQAAPTPPSTAEHPAPSTGAAERYATPTRAEAVLPQTRAEVALPQTRAEALPADTFEDDGAPGRPRRRLPLIVGALLLVAALAVGGTLLARGWGTGAARGVPLTATAITQVYFQGTAESSGAIDNVLTGDSPSWRTDYYRTGPGFGGLKSGTGLLITLDREATLTGGTITSPSQRSTVQIRTSATATISSLDATRTVWDGTLKEGKTTFTASDAQPSRYVLVWITGLTQVPKGWSTTIEQVLLRGQFR